MGCRCNERRVQLRNAGTALKSFNVGQAVRQVGAVSSSFAQDLRNGSLRQAAAARLAAMRKR
jgi:hypothetical protein